MELANSENNETAPWLCHPRRSREFQSYMWTFRDSTEHVHTSESLPGCFWYYMIDQEKMIPENVCWEYDRCDWIWRWQRGFWAWQATSPHGANGPYEWKWIKGWWYWKWASDSFFLYCRDDRHVFLASDPDVKCLPFCDMGSLAWTVRNAQALGWDLRHGSSCPETFQCPSLSWVNFMWGAASHVRRSTPY